MKDKEQESKVEKKRPVRKLTDAEIAPRYQEHLKRVKEGKQ